LHVLLKQKKSRLFRQDFYLLLLLVIAVSNILHAKSCLTFIKIKVEVKIVCKIILEHQIIVLFCFSGAKVMLFFYCAIFMRFFSRDLLFLASTLFLLDCFLLRFSQSQ
jgi:hypothetical protein